MKKSKTVRKWKSEPEVTRVRPKKAAAEPEKKVRMLLPNAPDYLWYCPQCRFFSRAAKRCILCGADCVREKTATLLPMIGLVPYVKAEEQNGAQLTGDEVIDAINRRCAELGCPGKVVGSTVGPIITRYDFGPDRATRVGNLRRLNEDLALALSAESVMVHRIPGTPNVAIAVPNKKREVISFEKSLAAFAAATKDMEVPLNLGTDAVGNWVHADLTAFPHLLIGGSTGAGKSVELHNLLVSLLYVRSPKKVRLVLGDPKHVELSQYQAVPHLLLPPESSVHRILDLLERQVAEMEDRMGLMKANSVQNLREYNARMRAAGRDELPYIVVVIDEMADIVLQEKKSFTEVMAKLSSMARASGIHVICATQRPSVDVLSGKIKVNFPARLGFKVPSRFDSKTVMDEAGMEQLLGKGDMLFKSPEHHGLKRLHAPMVHREDVQRMVRLTLAAQSTQVPADFATPAAVVGTDNKEVTAPTGLIQ